MALLVERQEAKCPCHLGIGQEAVAVGVSAHLTPEDRVFGGHRSHAHYLALGGDLYAMFAEILGRADGASKGMGGSMHLYGPSVGFHGSVPIVGATIPVAVGAALAAKMDGGKAIAVAYFGDGACEEGALHESFNLAAIMRLPVVFVCENNLYASHLDIKLRQPYDSVARFAIAHGMAANVVDGNDVVAVSRAAKQLITSARDREGPGFLEAVTYRWRGHVGPQEDIDVGVRRSLESLAAWKRRDPIGRLALALIARGEFTEDRYQCLSDEVRAEIDGAVEMARHASYPLFGQIIDMVYARTNGAS